MKAGDFAKVLLALTALLAESDHGSRALAADSDGRLRAGRDPFQPRQPHFTPPCKNVIFLYMQGGMSLAG